MLYEREESLALLADAAAEATGGSGRVVLVRGEAGIGKTSVVQLFLHTTDTDALIGRCDDASVPLVLGPFREIFGQAGVPLTPTDAEDARSHITEVLQETSCIVIEDLHWADEATLDLMSYVGRRIADVPVTLILTMRPTDDPHVARCIAQLPADQTLDIELQPLSHAAVAALSGAAGRLADEVFEQSKGNPFLVTEILASRDGVVPMRVANSMMARMSHQSEAASGMAELLSVFPAGASWDTLERLRPRVTAELEELEKGGWLEVSDRRVGFRHELVRRAVDESLSTTRRRSLNREVLDFLTSSGADSATLAHHAEQAGATQQFLEHTVVAAREFARAGAHRDALTHLQRAEPHSSLLPEVERARFAEALGTELVIGDVSAEAQGAFRTAAGRWERLGDRDSQARALAGASTATRRLGDVDGSVAELQAALDLLGDSEDRDLVVRTRANMAQVVGLLSRWPEALVQVEKALEDAEVLGGDALAIALGIRGNARRILGDATGRSDLVASIDLSLRLEDQSLSMTGYVNLVAASLGTFDLAHIDAELAEALSYSDEVEFEFGHFRLEGHRCYLDLLRGAWDEAFETSSRINARGGDEFALIRPRLVEGMIRMRRGDNSGVEMVLDAHNVASATADIQRLGPAAAALAEMQWLGKTDASAQIRDASELARSSGHARHSAELALWCRRLGIGWPAAPSLGPAPFLAELAGEWAAAVSGWEEMGLPYYRTLTLGFSDDPDAMREAVVEATRLGASTTADRLRARLREKGHRISRGPGKATLANPGGLTERQVDVVKLLAAGLTNQEIADRLFISPKTADHHVSAILTSLGVEGRRSAGEWAIEQGLAEPD